MYIIRLSYLVRDGDCWGIQVYIMGQSDCASFVVSVIMWIAELPVQRFVE